jgi:hypothetical protein
MPRRLADLAATFLAAALVSGCSSAPSHFYLLNATATADGGTAVRYAVAVGPVSIPASVDQPQIVLQAGPNRVVPDEFSRWAAPLQNEIGRVVAADLAALLGTPRVTSVPLARFDAAYRVAIDVQRFESTPGESAVVEAVWVVAPAAGGAVRSGHTLAREPAGDGSVDALVAAHSRALAVLSADIAAAVRAAAAAAR